MPWKVMTSMVCISTILVVALLKYINGVLLSVGIAAIAGLGGYVVARKSNSSGTPTP